MKILVIAKGRCGSHSLIDWLAEEFNLKTIYENEDEDGLIKSLTIETSHPLWDEVRERYP